MGGTSGTIEVPPSRLNPTDAALWDIERNPMLRTTIVAVMVLDRPIDATVLATALELASRRIPRLRQRVVGSPAGVGTPHWEIVTDFAVSDHVRVVDAPDGVTTDVLTDVASRLAGEPFDRARPLWEAVYLDPPAGPAALILKVHHSLTDGVGGIGLLDVILDRRRRARPIDPASVAVPIPGRRPPRSPDEIGAGVRRVVDAPWDAASAATTAVFHPVRTANGVWEATRSAGRLLAPSSAPLSPLLIGRGPERHAGMSELDLGRLHDAAGRHGCTINHAFFAGVVGGITEYHRALGADVDRLRVTMPVSFRRSHDGTAGNQWAPVRFVVPTDIDDPVDRMLAMRALVVAVRKERALSFSHSLAGLVQVLPSVLSSGVVSGMMHGVDVTLTNVPGLATPHYLAGASVERIYALAPTAGAALNVGLVSHLGTGCIGTLSDAAAVSDPTLLTELISAGMDAVLTASESTSPRPTPREPASEPPTPNPATSEAPRATDRLTALDAAFLRMEAPGLPMHIGGVFVIDGDPLRDADGRLRIEDARTHIEARLERLPRFRRRPVEVPLGLGRPVWVDDDDFDIARHVTLVDLSGGDRHDLLDLCAELYATLLDRSRPLWELTLVEGMDDGRIGIVERVHHALIDGISGVELAAAVFDLEPNDRPDRPTRRREPSAAPGGLRLVADSLLEQAREPIDAARRIAGASRSPRRLVADLASVASSARDLLGSRVPRAPFNAEVGTERVLRAVPLDLGTVRSVGEAAGATVNDVVLATVAGALRRWYAVEAVEPSEVHVLVPVSTRSRSLGAGPGNQVGAVVLDLPVAEPDPLRRLDAVHERMSRLKATHDGEGTSLLLDALDHVPAPLTNALTRVVAVQPFVNVVVTNVPGPPAPLHFLGGRIEEIVPVVPLGPHLGLGIAVLSYCDRLTVSLFADPASVADIDVLAAAVGEEFATLVAAVD